MIIGTRGSDLALSQARWVSEHLRQRGVQTRLQVIQTQGDAVQHLPFDKMEGKGFFTKEIEEALLAARIDVAVHSLKDLPTTSPRGLVVAGIPERADARDCLLVQPQAYDASAPKLPLRAGARVGTGAVRRRAQLAAMRQDLQLVDLRGNVPTRVRKLRDGLFDATLLACAGLGRLDLDLSGLERVNLPPEVLVPAPGQGALALQVRESDARARQAVAQLDDARVRAATAAERGLLARLEGGCQLPLGAHAIGEGERFRLVVFFGGTDSGPAAPSEPRRLQVWGDHAEGLAERAYRELVGS